MPSRMKPDLLRGFLMDRHGCTIGRAARMVLMARHPPRVASINGIAEVRPRLKQCPECYWLRVHRVGVLRIRAVRFDVAPRGRCIMHFRVLTVPLRFPVNVLDG